ncbi:hypothetical protein CANCADRAFT_30354 [Tortispora caseinolytica NRRL Y-17796]|uniref:Bystin n=1 Tax=Tortispora caseinolytica NRRL Y-17796 TaxID=767744 RepID=A0A1E4TK12_9ASCO|nr:hypothetical protein CANCADRAFT_30354 [Tortispora caseinolytica NRRL Y-17796]
MPKATKDRQRPSLGQVIENGEGRFKPIKEKSAKYGSEDEEATNYIDAAGSSKILQLAREQLAEEEEMGAAKPKKKSSKFEERVIFRDSSESGFANGESSEDNEDDYEDYDPEEFEDDINAFGDSNEEMLFENLLAQKGGLGESLGSQILNRIKIIEKKSLNDPDKREVDSKPQFPPKVVEVYEKIGLLLSRYRSGRLPKAFKIIPSLKNWESVVILTSPQDWTPHSVLQATKLFVSNLPPKEAQKFVYNVLLPRVREDISSNKVLNTHLYQALMKSLYKPPAFFKGFLFPLCEEEEHCTIREAVIVSSVLTKTSVPVLHSAAALLRLVELPYSPGPAIFIKAILSKKYALPKKVLDSVVDYFYSFTEPPYDTSKMPVVWHQGFLVLCQSYREDFSHEQINDLLKLARFHTHDAITPLIRRELSAQKVESMENP